MKKQFILVYTLLIFAGLTALCQPPDSNTYIISKEVITYTDLKIAMENPDAVESISLVGMKLRKIPAEVFQFKNLRFLDLRRNRITKIPDEIKNLTKLEELDLTGNKLEDFPEALTTLPRLLILRLRKNKLYSLPKSIGNLNKLEQLDLNGNPIWMLPDEMAKCMGLRTMDLRNTDIDGERNAGIQEMLPTTQIYFQNSCNCGPNN